MLGDADGNGAGGFAVLDAKTFELKGRWENGGETPPLNYDFWYQPRKNALVSTEFGEPNAYEPASIPPTSTRVATAQAPLLEPRASVRRTDRRSRREGPRPARGALAPRPGRRRGLRRRGSLERVWHFHRENGHLAADPVIEEESVPLEGWPFPVPGLITDLVLSMDDRFLYFANWLHGDVRQYDIPQPAEPEAHRSDLARRLIGKPTDARRELNGGPNMLQLSYDGRRLYVTNSLYSTWDNQFYPEMRSWLLRIDCDPNGGMEIDHDFFVDFHDRPGGPARAHEVRLQGGDCTTEIFQ